MSFGYAFILLGLAFPVGVYAALYYNDPLTPQAVLIILSLCPFLLGLMWCYCGFVFLAGTKQKKVFGIIPNFTRD